MERPFTKFTVIIPTRERADTLYWTIKTCLIQEYENLEIIVSDNFSQDNTRKVVESFNDERIRYINTGKRVSMTSNWEFALGHVNEGFVTIIGDDDAMTKNACEVLSKIVVNNPTIKVIDSCKPYYGWSSNIFDFLKNVLIFREREKDKICNMNSNLQDVLSFKKEYNTIPAIYHSFIHISIIQKIKELSNGKMFHSMIPDIYSAIAIAQFVDQYYYSSIPLVINGASGHSGGSAHFNPNKTSDSANKFLSEPNIPFHKKYIISPSIPIMLAESCEQINILGILKKCETLDVKDVLFNTLLQAVNQSVVKFNIIKNDVVVIANKNNLSKVVEEMINNVDNKPHSKFFTLINIFSVNKDGLFINGNLKKINNIYDASLFLAEKPKQSQVLNFLHLFVNLISMVLKKIKKYKFL